jgi:acyl-CoA-binding protein
MVRVMLQLIMHSVCMHAHLQEDFDAAAERIKPVTGPTDNEKLELYGLFKQATVGDNETCECTSSSPVQKDKTSS